MGIANSREATKRSKKEKMKSAIECSAKTMKGKKKKKRHGRQKQEKIEGQQIENSNKYERY